MPEAENSRKPDLHIEQSGSELLLDFGGDWLLANSLPAEDERLQRLGTIEHIRYRTDRLGDWDTGLVTRLANVHRRASAAGVDNDLTGLPEGARQLLDLAFAVQEREGARRTDDTPGVAESAGIAVIDILGSLRELIEFTGLIILSIGRLIRGEATTRASTFWLALQEAGAEALPIVGLISFLTGMIFAFVGVVQLTDFGAGIYTADLVAVAMVREMAAIMTGIIMAGRTGASYAAQLGTMKVNEEIDALTTLGINPIDFLVTPRFFALLLMMPLLTLYASLLGIAGGATVAIAMLDVSVVQYAAQTVSSLDLTTLLGGLFKATVYGSMVALTGTQQGIACGSSAMAVGQATTRAVVLGIVMIVVSAAVLTVVYINLGI